MQTGFVVRTHMEKRARLMIYCSLIHKNQEVADLCARIILCLQMWFSFVTANGKNKFLKY